MNLGRFSSVLVACALLMAAGGRAAHAGLELVTNGNFTQYSCPPPSGYSGFGTCYVGGAYGITGWTVVNGTHVTSNGSVDVITPSYWQAPPGGGNSVDLDGFTPGGLTQTITTTPGTEYLLSFEFSKNWYIASVSMTVTVGSTAQTLTYRTANSSANMRYIPEDIAFVATGTSTLLSFVSNDAATSAGGPVIGNVSVQVPEPLSLSLFGTALCGLGWCATAVAAKRHQPKTQGSQASRAAWVGGFC
jgi:choice-of-anchor C domain-containing protein